MGLLRLALTFLLGPPLFLVAALCAGASVAAQQGRHSLRWDLLTHFAPIWFAGALLAAIAALVALRGLSRWIILAMGIVGVLASGSLMAPEFTRSTGPHAGAEAPGQLKVIQFNVWSHNLDPGATVDWIVGQHPDIVILEETTPDFRRLVEARTGWRSACRDCEVMIYSHLPMARGYVGGGKPVGPLAHAVFHDAQGAFDVVGVHDAWPTDGADQQRQEARLARVLSELPRERTIATGDFNSTPWSFARRNWDQAFAIPRRDRAVFSWPAGRITQREIKTPFPLLPIDHVYAGPGWATVSVTRGPKLGSDHYPVVAILAPVSPPPAAPRAPSSGLQIEK
jgi:endonuclease/exonuclease/phosphatase (EEP) superfamily protein YafD